MGRRSYDDYGHGHHGHGHGNGYGGARPQMAAGRYDPPPAYPHDLSGFIPSKGYDG